MFKYKVISSAVAIAVMVNFIVNLKFKSPDDTEEASDDAKEEVASNDQARNKKINPQSTRRPASTTSASRPKAAAAPSQRPEIDNSNFVNVPAPMEQEPIPEPAPTPVNSSFRGGYQSFVSNSPVSIPLTRQNASGGSFDGPRAGSSSSSSSSNPGEAYSGGNTTATPIGQGTGTDKKSTTTTSTPTTSTASSNSGGSTTTSSSTVANTCSSNIAAGAFSNPIGITLSCTSVSTIKYCIGLDTGAGCCDPKAAGSTYSTKIIVGPKNGNYCLSYYGQSTSTGDSTVYKQSYTINSTLPNLQVAHPKINYQTTQLAGKSFITSTDFGKVGYGIGQINLKAHDPSPSALNLDCDGIMANYASLPAPVPTTILSLLDTSLDNPALQIEIPFQLNQLEYGDNFITSYAANTNFAAPIYSCSTTKVTLNDFEYFQEDLAFGDTGTNTVREFTGGLSPYGFFEDAATVYRGPAGADTLDNAGQKLAYGMFGIFY